MNKIDERMRARLASADCPVTQILSAYQATHRGQPVTRPATPFTRADYERHERMRRHAVATFPELRELRQREQREAEARRKRAAEAPAHPYARYLFPE